MRIRHPVYVTPHVLVLMGALLLLTAMVALGNPMPDPAWTELGALVPVFAEDPSAEVGEKLATLLRMSPGALVIRGNADIVAGNWQLFSPYVLEVCRPGVPISIAPHVPEVYLRAADQVHREAMLEILRSWLTPEPISAEVSSRYKTVFPVSLEQQIAVAEILSDAQDAQAIPAIRAFQTTIPAHTEAWVHLDQAVMRMEAPLVAGLLTPTEDGGVRLTRGAHGARVLVAGHVVDDSVAARIFHELGKSESHDRTGLTRGGVLVRIEFPDGLAGELTWSEANSFVYTDNTRQSESTRSMVGVRGWGLAAIIGEVLRAQGGESHPLAKMPN